MIYFTVTTNDCGTIIDSISEDFHLLKEKFPNSEIYGSKKPITSIVVNNLDAYTKVTY